MTAESLYKDFLTIVRKERTSVIKPVIFNQWVKMAAINWVKLKLPSTEFNQKRIDDLQAIHVLTDGVQYDRLIGSNIFNIPTQNGREYMHGLSAAFLDCTLGQTDPTTNADPVVPPTHVVHSRVPGKILRADKRVVTDENPYRKPDGSFVYFELRDGKIVVKSDGKIYRCCELEYYCIPEFIIFDPNDTRDSTGSFNETQNQEIVELAARKYLERVQDVRYRTFAGEQSSTPT